jgi:hypothetical protein
MLSTPALAVSNLLFDGSEFQVNTFTAFGQYGAPARSVARSPDGRFVVVWRSVQDGSAYSVHGQRFDSEGAASGTEFRVNTFTTGKQYRAAVSSAADGSFVIVWQSTGQDGSGYSIHGQRFDSGGAASGTEFRVNTFTTSAQSRAAVSAAADGSFVVVWESFGQDGHSFGVFGQRFDSAGVPSGTEFQVNTHTALGQSRPAVSSASSGSFVVVWDGVVGDGGSGFGGVFGQRFDSTGAPSGTEFQVNTYTTSSQYRPAVSVGDDGSFVVVWQSLGQDGSTYGIHGQRFDSMGAASGTEFQVNTYTTFSQRDAAVASAGDGSFVVVWQSTGQDGNGYSVHGQRFDSAGAAWGTEFQVNTYTTGDQRYSQSIAADAAGDFVVVWMTAFDQDGDGLGMFGQRLCDDANSKLLCDSQETTTTTTTLPYGVLGHFKCYKVKVLRNPRFAAQVGVTLNDQFENDVIDVLKPSQLCVPADKNGSGINDAVNHLCCYKIRGTKLEPAIGVTITDQFGSLDLEASAVKQLCQPCTKLLLP